MVNSLKSTEGIVVRDRSECRLVKTLLRRVYFFRLATTILVAVSVLVSTMTRMNKAAAAAAAKTSLGMHGLDKLLSPAFQLRITCT